MDDASLDDASLLVWKEEQIDCTHLTDLKAWVGGVYAGSVPEGEQPRTVRWMGEVFDAGNTCGGVDGTKAEFEAAFRDWLAGFRLFMDAGPTTTPTP